MRWELVERWRRGNAGIACAVLGGLRRSHGRTACSALPSGAAGPLLGGDGGTQRQSVPTSRQHQRGPAEGRGLEGRDPAREAAARRGVARRERVAKARGRRQCRAGARRDPGHGPAVAGHRMAADGPAGAGGTTASGLVRRRAGEPRSHRVGRRDRRPARGASSGSRAAGATAAPRRPAKRAPRGAAQSAARRPWSGASPRGVAGAAPGADVGELVVDRVARVAGRTIRFSPSARRSAPRATSSAPGGSPRPAPRRRTG